MLNTLKLGPTGRKQRGVNKRILLEKLLILEIKSTEKYNKQLLPSKMNKHCHASDFFKENTEKLRSPVLSVPSSSPP